MRRALWLSLIPCSLLLGGASVAFAQFGGQPGGMGPGMGPQPGGDEPREEGPAEAAPDEGETRPAETEPIGAYPEQERLRRSVVEIDGYFRFRTDFMHNFHLGQGYVDPANLAARTFTGTEPGLRRPPFPTSLECRLSANCGSKNLGGANIRLRLEPTINITDQVRVRAQVDVFDNLLLGSTPDALLDLNRPGVYSPRATHPALSNTQDVPENGRNSWNDSVRAKRAWGEVDGEYGWLQFGRMPWHFGRGIAFNDGQCIDCDEGTTVDRVIGTTEVWGHQASFSWDFGAQGYHLGLTDFGRNELVPYPIDLSQKEDVLQLMAKFGRFETDRQFQERVARNGRAANYGVQLVYREMGYTVYPTQMGTPVAMIDPSPLSPENLAMGLTTDVDALMLLPSVWLKLGWKILTIEAEASGVVGRIENAGPTPTSTRQRLTLQQLGWVAAGDFRLYKDTFFIGLETGGATGDQAEDTQGYLNYRWRNVTQPMGDRYLNDFKFNPDYHVDEILFRRIIGTVTNAIYVKPRMTYLVDLGESRQLALNGAFIYSMAPVRVSTPGNNLSYGLEMNVGATYRNAADGFYAGATWGVLWPMGALNRGIVPQTGAGAGGTPAFSRVQDASAAQVLRFFLGITY